MFFCMVNTEKLQQLQKNREAVIRGLSILTEFRSLDLRKQKVVEKEIHNLLDTDLETEGVSISKVSADTEIILSSFTG